MSIVTVIGPTPPGTGVMAEAFSLTGSKSTSPTRRKPLGEDVIGHAVDADVDDDAAGGHHLGLDGPGHAHGRDEDIGLEREPAEVRRRGVAHGHRGVGALALLDEHGRQRLADDVAPAADDDVLAVRAVAAADEELDDAVGRAGQRAGLAPQHLADVDRMEAVDVLIRGNEVDDLLGADVFRQGQLDEEAVVAVVAVEAVDLAEDLLLGRVGRHADRRLEDADLLGGLGLGRHIGDRSGILADQDDGQAGHVPLLLEAVGPPFELRPDLAGNVLAADDGCRHGVLLSDT